MGKALPPLAWRYVSKRMRSELAGLPARLTRIVAERQKVETEIDGILSRLSQRAAEKAEGLEAGRSHPPASAEAAI
jgi:hypothetical protein